MEVVLAILATFGGSSVLSWMLRARIERLRAEREALISQRRELYLDILKPYVVMFVGLKGSSTSNAEKTVRTLVSVEYKMTAMRLRMFGSDEVLKALNELMQHIYNRQENDGPAEVMSLYGELLLAIRRDLGNPKTCLTARDMLRSEITDIDQHIPN